MKMIRDSSVPDGEYVGVDADGNVVSRVSYIPVFKRLFGTADDEDRVVVWRTSPEGMRRIAALVAWAACGSETVGRC